MKVSVGCLAAEIHQGALPVANGQGEISVKDIYSHIYISWLVGIELPHVVSVCEAALLQGIEPAVCYV